MGKVEQLSNAEAEKINDMVRGMTEMQMRQVLICIPYKFLYDELIYRYERLLDHYSKTAEEVAAMTDILPQ